MKLSAVLIAALQSADAGANMQIHPQHIPHLESCTFGDFGDLGDERFTPDRIVNGKDAPHGSWPWIVGFTENGMRVCSGTIIHDRWILSAEHCFPAHIPPAGTNVITAEMDPTITWTALWLGDNHKRKSDGSEIQLVPQKLVFPADRSLAGYRDTRTSDTVLIQVESISARIRNLPSAANYIKPACLPQPGPSMPEHGTLCWIAGWGYRRYEASAWGGMVGSSLGIILQEAGVNIFSNEYCINKSEYELATTWEERTSSDYLQEWNEFCAGIGDMDGDGQTDGGIDACNGDSGGPLICNVDGKATLVGITSRGKGCALANYPGIYTRVDLEVNWINEMISLHTDPESATEPDNGTTSPETDESEETEGNNTEGDSEEDSSEEDSQTDLTLSFLTEVSERIMPTPNCFKGNGKPHPNKTAAQIRVRRKKMQALVGYMRKYMGPTRMQKSCGAQSENFKVEDFASDTSSHDAMVENLATKQNLENLVQNVIGTNYQNCRPVINWSKNGVKKVKGMYDWIATARRINCLD